MEKFGINGVDYGQNGGYNEECTTDFSGQEEVDRYWYHPDHLGSSSFVTGLDGEVNQNIEYFPSGETFVENHLNSYNVPYKFNSKELDDETGYYYYGARYYNPRVSLWLNVDPLTEKYFARSPYEYCFSNPINLVDSTDMGPGDPHIINIFGYVMFKNPSGWHYMRNSALDRTGVRIEGKDWHGDESAFYNPYNGKNYTLEQFRKEFSKAKVQGEPLGQTLARSAKATKTVAKIVLTSPETQPIVLAPLMEIAAAGSLVETEIYLGRATGGAARAAKYGSEWTEASLSNTISRFAPDAEAAITSTGKTLYKNSETGMQVVVDEAGGYLG